MIPTFDSVDQNPRVNLLAVYNKRLLAGYLDYIIIVLLLTAMRFKIVLGQPCHFKSLFVTRGGLSSSASISSVQIPSFDCRGA